MDNDPLVRAKTYPFPIPSKSFIFADGQSLNIGPGDKSPDLSDRTPVLAVGSNQSPEQLARKFPGADWAPIPVIRVRLRDFDSVYSPHIASYGAIAATLQVSSGVEVALFITWLDARQLVRMHETELSNANYRFDKLNAIDLEVELGPPLEAVYIYTSTHGTLCDSNGPIPVAEIDARGRSRLGLNQVAIQRYVRDLLAPKMELDTFIVGSIDDPDLRRRRSDQLKVNAQPFTPPSLTTVRI